MVGSLFWVTRIVFFPPVRAVGFLFPFASLLFYFFAPSAMALCAFRRTVSLHVSHLAVTNDRKKVCELLLIILRVIRFTWCNS